jgi:hypothetical protein
MITQSIDNRNKLPRRDWILLPLISVATVVILAASTELAARHVFNDTKTLLADCMVLDDPTTGPRVIPNSVCRDKSPESKIAEYKFDSCGFREGVACGPKSPGTYRIVVVGSSSVLGQHVQGQETFASLLPQELARRTHLKIDGFNAGMGWGFPPTVPMRMNQILASNPDLILWAVSAGDIEGAAVITQVTTAEKQQQTQKLSEKAWMRVKQAFNSSSISGALPELFDRTRTSVALRHLLFLSQSQHIKSTLSGSDLDLGFLRADFSPDWQDHLRHFDLDFVVVSERARRAGVPLVVTFTPYSTQAAMISVGEWPYAFDPYKLDNEVRKIVERRGGTYLDILPQYRTIPNPEEGYFPVDGHANPSGHALLARLLANALTNGTVAPLQVGNEPQTQERVPNSDSRH